MERVRRVSLRQSRQRPSCLRDARAAGPRGKKTILFKGGRIAGSLGAIVDLIINAQDIKRHITVKKQKPGFLGPGLADR